MSKEDYEILKFGLDKLNLICCEACNKEPSLWRTLSHHYELRSRDMNLNPHTCWQELTIAQSWAPSVQSIPGAMRHIQTSLSIISPKPNGNYTAEPQSGFKHSFSELTSKITPKTRRRLGKTPSLTFRKATHGRIRDSKLSHMIMPRMSIFSTETECM